METVILYAYYETNKTIENLNFFLNIGINENDKCLYVIVINGYKCSVELPNYKNCIILKRENIGYDFGAHNYGLEYLKLNNLEFKYYLFINCSVIGPFIPSYYPKNLHWSNIFISKLSDTTKLIGTTISCLPDFDYSFGPKVGGYCFATDSVGLSLLIKNNIFVNHTDKTNAIYAEYRLSDTILNNGYNIDCLLYKYQNINWLDKNNWNLYNNIFPDRQNTYFGISIHPFEVVFHKWYWAHHPNNLVNYEYVNTYKNWKLSNIITTQNFYNNDIPFNSPFSKISLNIDNDLEYGILYAIINKKKYVIIDKCNKNIDIDKLNNIDFIKNIKFFDKDNIYINIIKAEYGVKNIFTIDVTDKIKNYFMLNGKLPNISNMNIYFGEDPCLNIDKYLYLEYSINNFIINDIIEENYMYLENIINLKYLKEDICLNDNYEFKSNSKTEIQLFINIINIIKTIELY